MMSASRTPAFLLSLLALAMLLIPGSLSAQSESQLQQKYIKFLNNEMDLTGTVDGDGDVQFTYEDHTYFIEVNEEDPEFFRLVIANIWPIESISEQAQVLEAVDAVNRQLKVVKAYTTNDNVWIAMEVFLEDVDDYEAFFGRGLNILGQAIDLFVEKM
jgi:hypothetical protein